MIYNGTRLVSEKNEQALLLHGKCKIHTISLIFSKAKIRASRICIAYQLKVKHFQSEIVTNEYA